MLFQELAQILNIVLTIWIVNNYLLSLKAKFQGSISI